MFERRLVQSLIEQRKLVVLLAAMITAVAVYQAKDLEYDNSIEAWFLKDDPDILTYNAFLERFEADQLTVSARSEHRGRVGHRNRVPRFPC